MAALIQLFRLEQHGIDLGRVSPVVRAALYQHAPAVVMPFQHVRPVADHRRYLREIAGAVDMLRQHADVEGKELGDSPTRRLCRDTMSIEAVGRIYPASCDNQLSPLQPSGGVKHSALFPKETTVTKYEDVTREQTEACITRMGGWSNFLRFIGGQGRILFDSVLEPIDITSNGLSGEKWIERLEKEGYRVGDHAKEVLRSESFVTTDGVAYRLAVIKGSEFDHDLSTDDVRSEATKRGYLAPPAEVATQLREIFTDDELERLDLWWLAVMHEPFLDPAGEPRVLRIDRVDERRWLYGCWAHPGDKWDRCGGFVFLIPQQIR